MLQPRSHKLLIVAGLLGLLFFWLTDARYGVPSLTLNENARDVINARQIGTIVGVAGSVALLLLGTWLSVRRMS